MRGDMLYPYVVINRRMGPRMNHKYVSNSTPSIDFDILMAMFTWRRVAARSHPKGSIMEPS